MNRPSFQKQKGHAPLSSSLLAPRNEVSLMDKIHRTSKLDQHSPKVMWHKEVVGLMYMVDLVETTLLSIVMASGVVSSVGRRDNS